MIDWDRCHGFKFGEAKVHGNSPTPILTDLEFAPICNTPAGRTEVEGDWKAALNQFTIRFEGRLSQP